MHERLVFELLGIRERIAGNVTRKALSTYQDTGARLHSSDEVNMHKAPLRSAPLLASPSSITALRQPWNGVRWQCQGTLYGLFSSLQIALPCNKAPLRSLILCPCPVLALG